MSKNVPMQVLKLLIPVLGLASFAFAGGASKGIGPVTELKLEKTIQHDLALAGQKAFIGKCMACHKFEEKYVGPALKGVTQRRQPEWIMNMILNPQQMIQEDAEAKELFEQLLVPMADQHVTKEDARAMLEYFRSIDELGPSSMPALPGAATPTASPAADPVTKSGKTKSKTKKAP